MQPTKIHWASLGFPEPGFTHNPLRVVDENGQKGWACIKYGPGCANCWSESLNKRFGTKLSFTVQNVNKVFPIDINVNTTSEIFGKTLDRKIPTGIFMCDTTDFLESNIWSENMQLGVFAEMMAGYWHRYAILTKRILALRDFIYNIKYGSAHTPMSAMAAMMMFERREAHEGLTQDEDYRYQSPSYNFKQWQRLSFGFKNIWLGVTLNVQPSPDEVKALQDIRRMWPGVLWCSNEPALSEINWDDLTNVFDWIVSGGEVASKDRCRPTSTDIFRSARDACSGSNIPFYFKQYGNWAPFPGDLRDGWTDDDRCVNTMGQHCLASNIADLDGNPVLVHYWRKQRPAILDGQEYKEFPKTVVTEWVR